MTTQSLIDQAEIINKAHAIRPEVQHIGMGLHTCIIQRWRGYLGEYDIPSLAYPILTVISGGRAKIKRLNDASSLSIDHAMPGDIALIPRHQPMKWRVNGEMDVSTIIFENPEICDHLQNLYDQILNDVGEQNYVGTFSNPYIFTNCNHLTNILTSTDSVAPEYIDIHLKSIELYVLNYLGKKDYGLRPQQLNSHPVTYTIQRLTMGVSNKIHVEDIAEELRVSPAYLTKKFKQEVGITPHHFLLLKRLKKAKSLLANTEMDIATIAVDCGFSHQSHLTRHFSKLIGLSPLKFRQHAQRGLKSSVSDKP